MDEDHGDLVPLQNEHEATGFDVVLRGYDRRQVEDYVEQVEVAHAAGERQHAEDAERLAALEAHVAALQASLGEAQERASGQPEPASRIGQRMATMLGLAEQEAEQIVEQAREHASRLTAERTAELDRREQSIATAAAEADQLRLEAQRDAESVRGHAHQESQTLVSDARRQADEMAEQTRLQSERRRAQAEQELQDMLAATRAQADAMTSEAQRQVEEATAQRDAMYAQLQALHQSIGAAVGPLASPPPATGP